MLPSSSQPSRAICAPAPASHTPNTQGQNNSHGKDGARAIANWMQGELMAALKRRAKIILWTEHGLSDRAIARRLQVSQPMVGLWRRRFRTARCQSVFGVAADCEGSRCRRASSASSAASFSRLRSSTLR